MMSEHGRSLTLADKLLLRGLIATGLKTLHSCGIIHGDIKPQNVLVMRNQDSSIYPQVADFGYSRELADQNTSITMAHTLPWNAPEILDKGHCCQPGDAIRTDVHSFGLLCLWICLRDEIAIEAGITADFADEPALSSDDSSFTFRTFTRYKDEDELRNLARRTVLSHSLEPNHQTCLLEVIDLTLPSNSSNRAADFQAVCSCFSELFPQNPFADVDYRYVEEPAVAPLAAHCDFEVQPFLLQFYHAEWMQISQSITQLLQVDVKIRECIVNMLLNHAQHAPCLLCRSNAAFQFAVCLSIGFGGAVHDIPASSWVQMSNRSQEDFDRCMSNMSKMVPDPQLYRTVLLSNSHNAGYLHSVDLLDIYGTDASLESTKISYETESARLVSALGAEAILSQISCASYAIFLRRIGHFEEAIELLVSIIRSLEANPHIGIAHLDTQNMKTELAITYDAAGGTSELLLDLCEDIRKQREQTLGPESPYLLVVSHIQANVLRAMGSFEEAEKMYKKLLLGRQTLFGKAHIGSLNVTNDLSALYHENLRYDEALVLVREGLKTSEQLFGPSHYNTLTMRNNLATVMYAIGDVESAQEILDQTLFLLSHTLGDEHPDTGTVLSNVGSLLAELGDYAKSTSYFDKALLIMKETLGSDHPRAANILFSKAMLAFELGADYGQTDELFQSCLEAREKVLGKNHPDVLDTLLEYCHFLGENQKLEESKTHYLQLLERQKRRHGDFHIAIIATMSGLADVLSRQNSKEAEEYYRSTVAVATEVFGGKGEFFRTSLRNLASYLEELPSGLDEAERLYRTLIETQRQSPTENFIELHEDMDRLVKMLHDQKRFGEAEVLQIELINLSQEIPGNEVHRLDLVEMLAMILSKAGEFEEADIQYGECMQIAHEIDGEGSSTYLRLNAGRAWNLELAGEASLALSRINETLLKSEEIYEASDVELLGVKSTAGAIYFRQGNQETAVRFIREVVEGSRKTFGTDSVEYWNATANCARYEFGVDSEEYAAAQVNCARYV